MIARRIVQVALLLVLMAACAGLASPAPAGATPRGKCHARAARAAHVKRCKAAKRKAKRHRKHARPKAKKRPGAGNTSKPGSGGSPSAQRTLSASAANLTSEERAAFEAVNRERSAHGVAALSTSSELQAISEERAKKTVEQLASTGTVSIEDIRVAIQDAGYCVTSQREIESGGPSSAALQEREEDERRLHELLESQEGELLSAAPFSAGSSTAAPASVESSETTEEHEIKEEEDIPLEPQWTLLGVASAEAGAWAVTLEDFVEPC